MVLFKLVLSEKHLARRQFCNTTHVIRATRHPGVNRMKFQLLLPLTIGLTVALVVIIKTRKQEHDQVDKRNRFERMKLRVTNDLLGEHQTEKISLENKIESAQKEEKALQTDTESCEQKAQKKKKAVEACQLSVKSVQKKVPNLEGELRNLQGETSKEKDSWIAKLESLKKEQQAPSALCGFLKKGADSAKKLCGVEPEAPKIEAPKTAQPKAETPKPEKSKAEAPKQEAKS
ncbi:uncharacterized protein LOC144022152 isoform X2 [Festucalex cinctus]